MSKDTYYIHSTGIIKGPNPTGRKTGSKNKHRAEWGNLFTRKRAAEKARTRMAKALTKRWWQL